MKENSTEMKIPLLAGEGGNMSEEEGYMPDEEKEPFIINEIEGTNKQIEGNDHKIIKDKLRWTVVYIMYFTMFVQIVSYASSFGSLWPYLKTMDEGVTETFLGWTVCGRSLLGMICCLLFGVWLDKRPWLEPLILSIILYLIGNILYIAAESFGCAGVWIALISQLLLGVQGGVFAISRTLVTHYSYADEVSKSIAHLNLFETIGFTIGPAIQAIGLLFDKNSYESYYIDLYTAPAYFMILLGLINSGLYLLCYYKDLGKRKIDPSEMNKSSEKSATSESSVDKLVVAVLLMIFFIIIAEYVFAEVIQSPVLMEMIGCNKREAVKYGAIMMVSNASLVIIVFLLISPLSKCISDKNLLLFGLASIFVIDVLHYPFGPGKLELKMPDVVYPNGTIIYSSEGGCPYEYAWCHTTPRLPFAQLIVANVLAAIPGPIAMALVSIIYAKIIDPYRQGFYMGLFAGAGALSRAVSPSYISYVYKYLGARPTVYLSGGLALLAILLLFIIWKRIKIIKK